jgi:fluoride exporter
MKQILLVGIGGFIGSIARYLVARLNTYNHYLSIPIGTLTVNIIGSFIIGFIAGIPLKNEMIAADLKLFLMVGICGGFTTFSSFSNENLNLMQNGQLLSSFAYIALSVILGLGAVFAGQLTSNLFQ